MSYINVLSKRNLLLVSVFFILVSVFSCKKNQEELGFDTMDKSLLLEDTKLDTFGVPAHTISIDSFTTIKAIDGLVGNYIDPVFGEVKSGFATQIRLSNENVDFNTESLVSLDSMVLYLTVDGYYGKGETTQKIQVFELTEELDGLKSYQYFDQVQYNETPIGDAFYSPTDTLIKIKLNLDYASKVLFSDPEYLTTNESFLTYIKGLYISSIPLSGDGAITYCNLSSKSKATLYFKSKKYAGNVEDVQYDFYINYKCTNYNHFSHNYISSELNGVIDDTLTLHNEIYLQAMAGAKALITLPDLSYLTDNGDVIINKAELIIEADTIRCGYYNLSTQLFLITEDVQLLPDYYISEERFGGELNSTNKSFYSFNITSYAQNSLLNNINKKLQLYVSRQIGNKADRVVLKNNIKLVIGYTKL